jgi:hypothetical protein
MSIHNHLSFNKLQYTELHIQAPALQRLSGETLLLHIPCPYKHVHAPCLLVGFLSLPLSAATLWGGVQFQLQDPIFPFIFAIATQLPYPVVS